jgi:hypothetical protein
MVKDSTGRTHKICKSCQRDLPLVDFCLTPKKRYSMYCLACGIPTANDRMRKWYKEHTEHSKITSKQYYQKNREERLAYQAEWRANNKEHHREASKKSMSKKPEYYKQLGKEWRSNNKDKIQANNAKNVRKYEERVKIATPRWADLNAIQDIYLQAAEFRRHGVNIHVDHIIPLRGKYVSGLHVENNLQLLSAKENYSKSNKPITEMLKVMKK